MKIKELRDNFIKDELNLEEFYEELIKKIKDSSDLNIFITFDEQDVKSQIEELKNKKNKGRLYGVPVTLKDNISYKGLRMTCGSKALENFNPVFNATVVKRLKDEGAIILGKVNMDEFAMGSSSETSYYGPTRNPLDPELVPGGSSSGSAASVAADLAVISLGSDTGGSVRQPAQYCNVIGYIPSYGSISRCGVVSMANTLDQVGILSKNVEDVVETLNIVGGHDEMDMTSTNKENLDIEIDKDYDFKNKKIGIVDLNLFDIDDTVKEDYLNSLNLIRDLGADLVELNFEFLKYSTSIYTVVMASEVSSNMSRFDGIRFGYLTDDYNTTDELYTNTRTESFGEEVQRRIALGTMFLASDSDQKIYKQGQKVRNLLSKEFQEKFDEVDFILTPTATNLPYKIGERVDDPLAVYDSGTFNVPVNLCGLCAISVPIRKGISGSLQFIGNRFEDKEILSAAYSLERSIRNEL
ncbi:Asp-tRNA(Asn)/Glu-tRNA(Gln) amidotransferase subunit GatA [Lagierella sp.]|uniref:Asp-tRNA(Asn)/Glu-tRNA(Gln) amidotransferase subunit GatA n=1 Tax=Lagierella sp. TaxID=2849657 RepID=UPI002624FCEC|nr:Asp-tRNA(Asn)/Glu-tRNA(Gln) amidotransferase subunit GatA [Lagierella sp.]